MRVILTLALVVPLACFLYTYFKQDDRAESGHIASLVMMFGAISFLAWVVVAVLWAVWR